MLPLDCKDRRLRVSSGYHPRVLSLRERGKIKVVEVLNFFELGLQRRLMLDRPSRTTWARDGTERRKFCSETRTTTHPLTYSRWAASWLSSSRWGHSSPGRASKTKCNRFARCWAHRPAWTGQMDSNLLSSSATSSQTICRRTSTWWFRTRVMKPFSSYQTCFSTIRPSARRLRSASSIRSFACAYRFQ